MKAICLILISFLISLPILGQNPLITNYTIKDGLPSNTVYTSYQDSKGFIWFGTDSGVTKFNGEKFETYSMNDGMSCNEILDIKEDCYGRIWFMNLNGTLNFYKNNTIFNEQNAPFLGEMKCDNFWIDFYQAEDSTIYFYSYRSDVAGLKYDRLVLSKRLLNRKKLIEHLSKSINNTHYLWARDSIYEYKTANFKKYKSIPYKEPNYSRIFPSITNINIVQSKTDMLYFYQDTSVIEVHKGVSLDYTNYILYDDFNCFLWIGTKNNGVYCFDNDKLVFQLKIKLTQNIYQDKENYIWITSAMNGIYKINGHAILCNHITKEKFNKQNILGLAKTNTDGIWITNGSNLYFIQNHHIYPLDLKIESNIINEINFFNGNHILINGNNTPLFRIKNLKFKNTSNSYNGELLKLATRTHVKKTLINNKNNNVILFKGRVLNILDKSYGNILFEDSIKGRIHNIFFNRKNELILNTSENYIFSEDTIAPSKELEPLNGEIILSHLILNKNSEIYNVNGQDLYLLNDSGLYNLSKELDYPIDLAIKHISNSGNLLFFSTIRNIYLISNPLDVIDGKELKVIKLSVDFNNINDIECQDSVIHIASDDGLTTIPIQVFLKEQEVAPKPYFDNILVDNKDYDFFNGFVSCRSDQRINIDYSAINFSSSVPIFNYMLDGIDKDWVRSSDKKVSYQNLKPGNYKFRLKASKNGKLFSETIELPVTITPTFFQKTLVKIILFLIIAVLAYLFQIALYRRRTRKKEIESQLINLEHKALQSMMNPHFIFNALGSIQRYLLQNKPTEAGTYLSQFARLIRQNMNSLKSNFISIDDEVERLRNYIELEQFRMNHKFAYKIEVNEKIDSYETSIPSMVIQPFVENAIWHGITPIPTGGLVTVRFNYLEGKSIQIIIEDNGIGISITNPVTKSDQNLNLGMELTRKRISLIGERMNTETKLYTEDLNPGTKNPGTRITIIVPAIFEG